MAEAGKQRLKVALKLVLIPLLLLVSLPVLYFSTSSWTTYHSCQPSTEDTHPQLQDHVALETLHVLYGLSGNASGFLSEFETSLKSVLMNSPVDFDMTVHVMADQDAYRELPDIFNRTRITTWKTRNQISIINYNIESKLKRWSKFMERKMGYTTARMTFFHTIGAFFRLFADEVLDSSQIPHVVYMDTDVIVMSSLEALWKLRDDKAYFQFGTLECSGFLLLNLGRLKDVWELIAANRTDLNRLSKELRQKPDDQLVVRVANLTNPQVVTLLPPEWDVHSAALWRGSLLDHRPFGVGYQHFNGGGKSKENTFEKSNFLAPGMENKGWMLANYFIKIPWSWAKFHVESMVGFSPGKSPILEWSIVS